MKCNVILFCRLCCYLAGVALLMTCGVINAWAQLSQIVSPDPANIPAGNGSAVSFDLDYDTSNGDNTLIGFGVRMHWDSSRLSFINTTNRLVTGFFNEDTSCQPDTGDFDIDPDTDCFVNTAWVDFAGNWPNAALPTRLYTANFTSNLTTGQQSQINFSSSSLASGYQLAATSVTVLGATPPVVSLNPTSLSFPDQPVGTTSSSQSVILTNVGGGPLALNSVTASGDFDQTNNCPNSLNPNASCTVNVTFTPNAQGNRSGNLTFQSNASSSPDIVPLNGNGIVVTSSCDLDVDGNAIVDALTDGLLTIRYEFGFRGATLINGAVSTDCMRCTALEIEQFLFDCSP